MLTRQLLRLPKKLTLDHLHRRSARLYQQRNCERPKKIPGTIMQRACQYGPLLYSPSSCFTASGPKRLSRSMTGSDMPSKIGCAMEGGHAQRPEQLHSPPEPHPIIPHKHSHAARAAWCISPSYSLFFSSYHPVPSHTSHSMSKVLTSFLSLGNSPISASSGTPLPWNSYHFAEPVAATRPPLSRHERGRAYSRTGYALMSCDARG